MENKKILIADSSVEFTESLCENLADKYDLRVCNSGLDVQGLLEDFRPDVLVMDLALPGIDGIFLLKQLADLTDRPHILVTTCFLSACVEAVIAKCGIEMVVLKPCKAELLAERVQDLFDEGEQGLMMCLQPRTTITSLLAELNIPPKRRGFTYLERAINLYLEQPTIKFTKAIYPVLAREYHSTPNAVERAIRQMIHEAWEKQNTATWRMYFGCSREGVVPRPTNAEFISAIAERYRYIRAEQA